MKVLSPEEGEWDAWETTFKVYRGKSNARWECKITIPRSVVRDLKLQPGDRIAVAVRRMT